MDKLIERLGIDETFTKERKKVPTHFNNIRNNVPQKEDYNMMADLLELPKTKNGYRYLLVIVDLFSREFDIEPLKDKEPKNVLDAMKKCFGRKHLNKTYASLRTDSGNEFKGVFHKWLFDNNILHKVALPNRHKQLSTVESLNKQLGRLFNGYMNKKELETGSRNREWIDILDVVRTELNKIRKDTDTFTPTMFDPIKKPKFKVGDVVHERLDWPEDALGKKQSTPNFRAGDFRFSKVPKKITEVLFFSDEPYYRYLLEGIKNASYSESELIKSKEKETKFKVKKIIGKARIKNKVHYKIWWQGELKKNSTWEPKDKLIEDGLQPAINIFENARN